MGLLGDLFTMTKITAKLAKYANSLAKDLQSDDIEKVGKAFFSYFEYAIKTINDSTLPDDMKENMLRGMIESLEEKVSEAGGSMEDVKKIVNEFPELKKLL